jgi:proteasome beta subunit
VLIRGKYQGASFFELLEVDFPQLHPAVNAREMIEASALQGVPHGTTVLAMRYAEGVLMAGDRLATEGHRVASRDLQKVYPTDAHSFVAIAGAAGPAI